MTLANQGGFDAPAYPHGEMEAFSGVATSTYRLWRSTGAITLGTQSGNGRHNYSMRDLLSIRLINQLCTQNRIPAAQAALAAEIASDWFAENIERQPSNSEKACLVVHGDIEPRIALDSAELETILNESQGATVIRLSKFLDTALTQHTTTKAA